MKRAYILILLISIAGYSFCQAQTKLDSLRAEVQSVMEEGSKNVTGDQIRLLYHYLFEAKTAQSKDDIILAYQQMATRSYALGNTSDALKYYKLYVIELEELSNIELNRSQTFEKNLYENEIRALNSTIKELEERIKELENDKGDYLQVTEIIYLGLRIILVIGALLLLGWLYTRYKNLKKREVIEEPRSNRVALTEVLNNTKKELVKAETALDLSDILVNRTIPLPGDYLKSNKSIRKKFLLNQPMKLSGGAGLFLETKQNITIIAAFNSLNAGAAGGLLSSHICQLLDEIVNHLKIFTPSIILEQLESKINALFPAGVPFTGGVNAAILAYDNSAKTVTYSGANFPLFTVNSGAAVKSISRNLSLLSNENSTEFENEVIHITKGIRFYLSTAAFVAQRGGHDFMPFGEAGFISAIESSSGQSLEEQGEVLRKIYNDWMGGGDQDGDLLVFGFGY